MKIKNTKSNLVILTPEEGYLLKKSGKTYKNVILGMHDKPNAYEEIKDPNYIYETIFNKELYTSDDLLCQSIEETTDILQHKSMEYRIVSEITIASLLYENEICIPTANIIEGVIEYTDDNGYFIQNENTGLRTRSRDKSEYMDLELYYIRKGTL